mgnify:CR=1 FL=1
MSTPTGDQIARKLDETNALLKRIAEALERAHPVYVPGIPVPPPPPPLPPPLPLEEVWRGDGSDRNKRRHSSRLLLDLWGL